MNCEFEGCDKPKRPGGKRWCHGHAKQESEGREMRPLRVRSPKGTKLPCSVTGCDRPVRSRGWCEPHYTRWRNYGDPEAMPEPKRLRGADNPGWKGDECGYVAAHNRVRRAKGRPSQHLCGCGKAAQDWALINFETPFTETVNGCVVPYSPDPDDYKAMCKKCHKRMDMRRKREPDDSEEVGQGAGKGPL